MNFDVLEKRLLNEFQRDFPLSNRPFLEVARRLGVREDDVIESLRALQERGAVSRVGAVFRPHRVGMSTLAAMSVPEGELDAIAALINAYPQVNHNYEREHEYNLWFVVTGADAQVIAAVLADIEQHSGYPVLPLPLMDDYHIDLGFDLQWD